MRALSSPAAWFAVIPTIDYKIMDVVSERNSLTKFEIKQCNERYR